MAKTKDELLKEGKELGLRVNKTMSVYELTHRIKDKKDEIAAEKAKMAGKSTADSPKEVKTARNGEY